MGNKGLLLCIIFILSGIGLCSTYAFVTPNYQINTTSITAPDSTVIQGDTIPKQTTRYPVAKTSIGSYEELYEESPLDLKDPRNLSSKFEYNPQNNSYILRTKVGDMEVSTPFMLNTNEYNAYSLRKSQEAYYRKKNAEAFEQGDEEFNFLDMKFDIGALDKVFGPGGVSIKTQGSAEISFGIKTNKTDNPTLSTYARKKTFFDFDEKIQANVTAKVGDKMSFNMNYNTDATFDFDSQQLKLNYEGKEDEIIKSIEAGNVSMTTGSSLIRGGVSLFGIKTTMQFGKLTATALISQQESESKTINTAGGAQMTEFDFRADEYDENRHFFLAHFFRDNYDSYMSKLPFISSGITINRIEVWVTNKSGNYEEARNIVGFMDMGESLSQNSGAPEGTWSYDSSNQLPNNSSNSLYNSIKEIPDARSISLASDAIKTQYPQLNGGVDYAKVESARPLSSSEYTLNSNLGYISLKSKLNADEVLAVAFEYTYNGKVYQVGEFASNVSESSSNLFLKLLKSTTINTSEPIWRLMMKNIYSLNAYQIQEKNFRLNIQYMNDTTGTRLNYMPIGDIKNEILLRVMNLDRLDSNDEKNPDGFYDYIEGYTVLSSNGRVIFPVNEPFGSHLKSKLGNVANAEQYVFQELYDSTKTVAQQYSEKNKFYLIGEYQSSTSAEIRLNAMNVPRGSVIVSAGGQVLTENVDYSVDYNMGIVRIENESYIESGTPISVTLEDQSYFSMQRKTMLGLDLNYAFNQNFNIGATVMHLSEKPLTEKLNVGSEVLNNTLWGTNIAYNTQFQWLTNWVDRIPFVTATAPSTLSFSGEFAQLIPGESDDSESGIAYVDDFETSQSSLDIRNPYSWFLASTPYDENGLFPEAALSNQVEYGMNRAALSWYYIDQLFTSSNSSTTPAHLKSDLEQLSNHYVREVSSREVYPNKEIAYGQSSILQVLNLSYYPEERGPYNLDTENVDSESGSLLHPEDRWGGIMRKMDNTDFESSNIEYIQFWVLDPFIYQEEGTPRGGDLYFNVGELSEDILKDGVKSFENGITDDPNSTNMTSTAWGRVSRLQPLSEGFDQTNREIQDVGLDGLSDEEEAEFSSYKNYLEELSTKLSPEAYEQAAQDPANDNYRYYRSVSYDEEEASILQRYKYYNGVEGNSLSSDITGDPLYMASRSVPDIEDINQDNTLNEYERYYQYRVSMRPEDLVVGRNYISDKRTTTVSLRNGEQEEVSWYQFKIPLEEYEKRVGDIQDFKTIRFMRMFLTDFDQPVHLRFASLEMVRGEWRNYDLPMGVGQQSTNGELEISVVNIEENAGQQPVNYVLPPGISRVIDPGQSQITQLNEQAMTLKVTGLESDNALGVYKNCGLDMRLYKRLQMFIHAEQLIDDYTNLQDGEVSLFVRIGSDNTTNYYEYEIPLNLTPAGSYNGDNAQDRETVWPEENMLNFPLELLTDLKLTRNEAKAERQTGVSYASRYSIYDPDNNKNKATIIGNPSLSDISTMMIGVRNNARTQKDVMVWVNELRMTEFDQDGGWASKGNVNLGISDLATLNLSGYVETAGFGSIDQSLTERRLEDFYQYDISTMVNLGRFMPEQIKLNAPLYYSISNQQESPKYNPLDQDILLSSALDATSTQSERDSILSMAANRVTIESFSLTGLRFDIRSDVPMPYDPSNFTLGYSFNRQSRKEPTLLFENSYDYRGNLAYIYSPLIKPIKPFAEIKSKSKSVAAIKDFAINYLPNSIAFNTNISRYYFEQQLRDLDIQTGLSNEMPVTFSKSFLWDRQFALQWNPINALQLSFNSMTGARIEEGSGAVNKTLFPDEYVAWQDTVRQSLLEFGTPWNYNQSFSAKLTLPFNKIPVLNWISGSGQYNSTYTWDRGAIVDESFQIGNSIANQGQLSGEARLSLENLYNKSSFLKEVNTRFNRNTPTPKAKLKQPIKRTIALKADTTTVVKHNLDNKRPTVFATTTQGERYPLDYEVTDRNTITINNRDSVPIVVSIAPTAGFKESIWYDVAQYGARFAMSVRSLNVRYRKANTLNLPSFSPNIGAAFGQSSAQDLLAPGLDFAFGFTDNDFIQKSIDNGWLLVNDSLVSPAISSATNELTIDASLEPIKGLKITLNSTHTDNNNNQVQFMFDGMPNVMGGSFSMTHVALFSAFDRSSAANNYASSAFDRFQEYRNTIAQRLEAQYAHTSYPTTGYLSEISHLAGTNYNAENGGVNTTSTDVLIPAFLAAYTGQSGSDVELSPFPSLLNILPNWKATYNGLITIPFFKEHLRSINLTHAYRCLYTVGAYSSFLNWVAVDNNSALGFVKDEQSGMPIPSSPYNISSVTITESFAPLAGLDVTFKNSMTARVEYKNSRTLNLNATASQIVESTTSDLTIGAGYKIANLKALLKLPSKKSQNINNDLNLRADLSFRSNQALIRRFDEDFTQATSGTETITFQFTADYTLSKFITLRGFYDKQINNPLVSSTTYPISNSNFGLSVRLSLAR